MDHTLVYTTLEHQCKLQLLCYIAILSPVGVDTSNVLMNHTRDPSPNGGTIHISISPPWHQSNNFIKVDNQGESCVLNNNVALVQNYSAFADSNLVHIPLKHTLFSVLSHIQAIGNSQAHKQ